jgi:hypothetical protein
MNAHRNCCFVLLLLAPEFLCARTARAQDSKTPVDGICSSTATTPCLNQPMTGATTITGKAASGATIEIRVNTDAVGTVKATISGTFEISVNALQATDTIEADQTAPSTVKMGPVKPEAAPTTSTKSLYTLGLVGLNATGTSTSGPKAQYFVEFDVISPLHWAGKRCWSPMKDEKGNLITKPNGEALHDDEVYPLAGRCWLWLVPRIASAPQTTSTVLNSVDSTSSLTQGIGSQTISQITQTFEFQGGLEYYVIKPWNGALFGSGDSWAKTSISAILGGGTVTPFNSISSAPEYSLNNNLGQQFNQDTSLSQTYPILASALCSYGFTGSTTVTCPVPPASGQKTVAFVFPNRTRFYRDYYSGFRIRTFYFTGACSAAKNGTSKGSCTATDNYPGTFDVRFGQDETVTGGRLRGVVLTLTGSYPLPGTNGAIRVFGSSYLRLHKNQDTTSLVFVPSQSFIALNDPSVVVQPIRRSDQDYYRLGIGVDLIALINKWYSGSQAKTKAN